MLDRLVRSLETCPMVRRGDYNYFIHPITDGVPNVDPALLREVCGAMLKVLDLNGVEKIVVVEAMGIPIGSVLSTMTDIPMSIMRKRPYGLPKEIAVHQATGYSKGELYLNGINKGDRVVIIDDVVSTGGTMRALLQALEIAGADVADVCIAIQRGDPDIGRPYKSLVRITVDEKVHVVEQHL
jgi:adenine phosphoribosyltransferase